MGQQISFFRNATLERQLLAEVARIGLNAYGVEPSEPLHKHMKNLTAFGFQEPSAPSAWVDGDYIEYGYFVEAFSARLWFDPLYLDGSPKPAPICGAFKQLVKWTKRGASYDREARIWVLNDFAGEFREREEEKQRELALIVERNRQFAVQKLGARLVKIDEEAE